MIHYTLPITLLIEKKIFKDCVIQKNNVVNRCLLGNVHWYIEC